MSISLFKSIFIAGVIVALAIAATWEIAPVERNNLQTPQAIIILLCGKIKGIFLTGDPVTWSDAKTSSPPEFKAAVMQAIATGNAYEINVCDATSELIPENDTYET